MPDPILDQLFDNYRKGSVDLSLQTVDGKRVLVYGNNSTKAIYRLNDGTGTPLPDVALKTILTSPTESFRALNVNEQKLRELQNQFQKELDSGYKLEPIKRYNADELKSIYNIQNPVPSPTQTVPQGPNTNPGEKIDFNSIGGAASTLLKWGKDIVVGTVANANSALYSLGWNINDLGTRKVDDLRFTKSIVNTIYDTGVDLIKGGVNLAKDIAIAQMPFGEVGDKLNMMGQSHEETAKEIESYFAPGRMDYTGEEKIEQVKDYEENYLKVFEDFKKENKTQWQQPQGEPSWNNPEWVKYNLFTGTGDAAEFSLGLLGSNFLLTKGFGVIGTKMGQLDMRAAAKAKDALLREIENMPKNTPQYDFVKSRIGKLDATYSDAMYKAGYTGEKIGHKVAMVNATDVEAKMEAFGAYDQYMDRERERVAKEYQAQGYEGDQLLDVLGKHDFSQAQLEAVKAGESVYKANAAILMASNGATSMLLGLAPKVPTRGAFGTRAVGEIGKSLNKWAKPLSMGKGVLELGKEGWEEVYQTNITNYELDKDSGSRRSLTNTLLNGAYNGIKNLAAGDYETGMAGLTGALGSGAVSGPVFGWKTTKEFLDNRKAVKYIDVNKVNSVVTDPINNEQTATSHLKWAYDAMRNQYGKEHADATKDWQLRHTLEQEGINKIYYQARENGVTHEAATKQILKIINRSKNDIISIKHGTPYFGYADKKEQLNEIEHGLDRANKSYDEHIKVLKKIANNDKIVSPEFKQRLFEGLANAKEFESIGEFLRIEKDKANNGDLEKSLPVDLQKDISINEAYKQAYQAIIGKILQPSTIEKENLGSKKSQAADIIDETTTPDQAVDMVAANPLEAETIKAQATNESKKAINSALAQHTLHFENTLKSMVENGSVYSEELQQEIPITEDYLNALIKEYEEVTAPLIEQLGDPAMKQKQQNLIRKSVVAVTDKLQRAAGPHSIEDGDLTQRYESPDPQTQYLFVAERDKLYAKLNNAGITSDLAEAVRVAATPEQLQEVLSNITNEREKELVSDFYNVVPLVKKETKVEEEIPDLSQFPEYDEIEDMDHYDNYRDEVNTEMIEDLLDKDILKPCDL